MDSTLTSPVKLCSREQDASTKENLPAFKGSQLHSLNYCVYLSTTVQGSWAAPSSSSLWIHTCFKLYLYIVIDPLTHLMHITDLP